MARAAIYTRISQDTEGEGLGVARQEQDCRELCARRGWEVAGVYTDNDISAFSGKPRPAYRRLLEDIQSGAIQAVVAWHPDRLHRRPVELEGFIALVEATGCAVETVTASGVDLSTPSGRAVARTLGAWARYESEHKAERVRRKMTELAEQGEPHGGRRPYGWAEDRVTVIPAEAAVVREVAVRVLAGESLRSVARDLNQRGLSTVYGRAWSQAQLGQMLRSARISGRREHHGEITAQAVWPGLISTDDSDRLRRLLGDPDRRTNAKQTRYLLTGGPARCGTCGGPLIAKPWTGERQARGMACRNADCTRRVAIQADPVEALVAEAVLQAVDEGALVKLLHQTDDRAIADELAGVEGRMADLAGDWASGSITRGEWQAARGALVARQEALRRELDAGRVSSGLQGLPGPLRAAWPTLPLHRRQAVIRALIEAVTIAPATRHTGARGIDPDRVTVTWRA